MLKTKTIAYDGRGYGGGAAGTNGPALYLEKMVPFVKEVAVMVARSRDGQIVSYPCVETIQKDNICHVVIAPARIDGEIQRKARTIAEDAIAGLKGVGIFGVEMFLLDSGELLLNEIAPRPHNSGHYATEACHTSQFEQHLRCVLGLPLGSPDMKVSVAGMVNVLGVAEGMEATLAPCTRSLAVPGATIHMYGKKESRAGRKMGHITVVAQTMQSLLERLDLILGDASSSSSSSSPSSPSSPSSSSSALLSKKPI
ncbi:phosphoribosylaminoimidazole carboxylase ade2 [Thoreauomyces humboldtii]|nr:phosphoribosylaminoimidazole carboxylase ade2 [Thoreauomyces humboldtii]